MLTTSSFFKHNEKKHNKRTYRRPGADKNGNRAIKCGIYNRKLRRIEKLYASTKVLYKVHPEFDYRKNDRLTNWLMREWRV